MLKNNNSNLKQPRFLVHIHIVPRLWWWYFFHFHLPVLRPGR